MSSSQLGAATLPVEIGNISPHGLWVLIRDHEYFLSYDQFPWFRDARVREILDVELVHDHHLHWPQLDVDLDVESLEHPDRFPLVSE